MAHFMTFGRARPLQARFARILNELASAGPTKAMFFDEEDIDPLFKMRPRLIQLAPGHDEAVVEITPEGVTRLKAWLKKGAS